jgi:hypothetical protein
MRTKVKWSHGGRGHSAEQNNQTKKRLEPILEKILGVDLSRQFILHSQISKDYGILLFLSGL